MDYKAYPTEKDTPSRKTRKSSRNSIFLHNKYALRRERAEARRARKEAQAQETALENE